MLKKFAAVLLAVMLSAIGCAVWASFNVAVADADITLAMENDAGGHIYLTRESCDTHVSTPDAVNLCRAYSVALEGTDQEQTFEGCWTSPELDMSAIPAEYARKAERVVIIYAQNGMQFNQLLSDFQPVVPAPEFAGQF